MHDIVNFDQRDTLMLLINRSYIDFFKVFFLPKYNAQKCIGKIVLSSCYACQIGCMPNVLPTRKINNLNFTSGRDALLFIKMRRVIYIRLRL